jgi:hypothetical protein
MNTVPLELSILMSDVIDAEELVPAEDRIIS